MRQMCCECGKRQAEKGSDMCGGCMKESLTEDLKELSEGNKQLSASMRDLLRILGQ